MYFAFVGGRPPVTVRFTGVLCCTPPPLPVTVIGYVPVAVLLPTVTVSIELPAPGAEIVVGFKFRVVPAGAPEAERLMELLNPLNGNVVMVEMPGLPCGIASDEGEAPIAKVDAATTVSEKGM